MGLNVAIAGATGAVGEAFRSILEERKFPVDDIRLLAGQRSVGQSLDFCGREIRVEVLEEFDFADTQIALFAAGKSVAEAFVPRVVEAGAVAIDNSSQFRYKERIPLVVPEINGHRIPDGIDPGIIANPNCSTIQMLLAIKPIYDAVGIKRINVATYQSVSGAGGSGIRELSTQVDDVAAGRKVDPRVAPVQIAFNAIPQIDRFESNGYTREEMKMVWETHKILEDNSIEVNATCVRVPVFRGHSEALHIETIDDITENQARSLIVNAPGVSVVDERAPGGYPTPAVHADGTDLVYVGRIRQDLFSKRGLNLWVVSDNVRKGAALNGIQIAEGLVPLLN